MLKDIEVSKGMKLSVMTIIVLQFFLSLYDFVNTFIV